MIMQNQVCLCQLQNVIKKLYFSILNTIMNYKNQLQGNTTGYKNLQFFKG